MRRRSGPRDSRLRTDENSHLPPNQSPLISPRQLITFRGRRGKKCDLEVHFFLNTVRTIGKGGRKKKFSDFPQIAILYFTDGCQQRCRGKLSWLMMRRWVAQALERERDYAPLPRISASPRSQTWFFFAVISFAFLFCFFFSFPAWLFFFQMSKSSTSEKPNNVGYVFCQFPKVATEIMRWKSM